VNICKNLFTFDDGTSKEPCKSSIINGEELNHSISKELWVICKMGKMYLLVVGWLPSKV
jgi:hypothetical protein